jgi:large subunit ribosomal protein L31e
MTELKREYVIPLRRKTRFAPKWRRSKKAVSVLREFIKKHMKTDNVIVCRELNEAIWQRGIKNPPGKVSVIALKMQNSQGERTLVNLLEAGIEKYAQVYREQDTIETPIKEEKEDKKTSKEEKVDTKEEKSKEKEVDTKEQDVNTKDTSKKSDKKEEVKKNE